jgi:prepilin-type N-terminal cleavage/methylation domain-containing protein
MCNSKGYTLVELLAVIVIMGICEGFLTIEELEHSSRKKLG